MVMKVIHLHWWNLFLFFNHRRGLLLILVGCMGFLLPFLDLIKICMSGVSIFIQLDSGIVCEESVLI